MKRLACFDALAGRPGDRAAAEHAFGGEDVHEAAPAAPAPEVGAISASIDRLQSRPFGERVFHLSNGQVWTELEPGRSRYRPGMAVTIERTTFGGYVLSTEGGRPSRVRRLE